MSNPGSWPRGGLPLGPSAYEEAMRPIYAEAVWRERNFYKADDTLPAQTDPTVMSQPSLGMLEGVTGSLGRALGDFKNFLMPGGQADWWRVGVVVGGLVAVGYFAGRRL